MSSLPDLLILGPPRTGTTSLWNYLTNHPDVEDAETHDVDQRDYPLGELRYFTRYYERGLDWYKKHFDPDKFSLESTTQYSYNPQVPERVAQVIPDVKLIQLNRDRINRTWSHFCMHRKNTGHVGDKSLRDYSVTQRGKAIIESSVYRPQVKRWLDYFHRDQLLIVKSEKMFEDTDEVYNEVLDFLGLPEYHLDEYKTVNDIEKPKIDRSTRMFLMERYHNLDREHRRFIAKQGLNYIGWFQWTS